MTRNRGGEEDEGENAMAWTEAEASMTIATSERGDEMAHPPMVSAKTDGLLTTGG